MNLAEFNDETRNALLQREEFVAFFVYEGSFFWIVDWDEHFNLDQMRNIDAVCSNPELMKYIPKGMTKEEYRRQAIDRYRGGIPTLTHELFPLYRDGVSAKVVSTDLLRHEFFVDDRGQYVELSCAIERLSSYGENVDKDLLDLGERLFSILPKFYINFDRRIFMHMVSDRAYEGAVPDGWRGYQGDFEHMIPVSHRYWARSFEEDFWAITSLFN